MRSAVLDQPAVRLVRAGLLATGIALLSLLAGLALGWVGGFAGPWVMVGLPLAMVIGALVVRDVRWAPLLVIVALPVGLVPLPGGLDLVQGVSVVAIGLVVLHGLLTWTAPLTWDRSLWWGAVLVFLALVSTGRAPDLAVALRQDIALVVGLLLVAALLRSVRTLADARRCVWALVLVGAVTCALSLRGLGGLEAVGGGQVVSGRLRGTFTEPNQFGTFSAMVLLLAVGLLLGARSTRERSLAIGCGLAALAALGLTLSRGAWMGTAIGVALMLVVLPSARRWLLAVGLPVVLAGATLATLQPDQPQVQVVRARVATVNSVQDNPYDDRPSIWAEGRREVVDSPWLGQGPGQFPVVSVRSASESASVAAVHAHSTLLTVAAELGLPAAALVVAFTLVVLTRVRRALRVLPRPRDRAVLAGAAGALAVVVGQGIIDFELRNPVIFATVTVVFALLLVVVRSAPPQPR